MSKTKGASEEAHSINGYLDSPKSQVINIRMTPSYEKESFNITNFQNYFLDETDRNRILIPIYKAHSDKFKDLLGIDYPLEKLERFNI